MNRKKILVFGATGAQGGSVARNLLARGRFDVRAITRKPTSPAAEELRALGAEVVKGDLDDPASLRAALEGCYGVFGVTNFWEHFENEEQQGRNLVDAVAASKVEHFVFSTLTHVAKATGGALKAPHFDIKAGYEDYARSLGLPATYVHVPAYFELFVTFNPPRPAGDGTYEFGFPLGDAPVATMSVEDVGLIVAPVFEQPEKYIGQVLKLAAEEMPASAYAEVMSRVTGATIRYKHVPREVFAALGFRGAEDLADMWEFYRYYMPSRVRDIEMCRAIAPDLQSFDTWVTRNAGKLRALLGDIQAA